MTGPSIIIPAGILALVAAILAWDRLARRDWARARLAAWVTGWLLLGAALVLAAGMRRAGGTGWRKVAARIRAIRPAPPAPERPLPAKPYVPRHGKPRMAVTAR